MLLLIFQQIVLPRVYRTTTNNIPTISTTHNGTPVENHDGLLNNNSYNTAAEGLLLTRQALHTYQSNNHLVHYKYNAYAGSCNDLPRYICFNFLSKILKHAVLFKVNLNFSIL